jgi:hypothetical protein
MSFPINNIGEEVTIIYIRVTNNLMQYCRFSNGLKIHNVESLFIFITMLIIDIVLRFYQSKILLYLRLKSRENHVCG